MATMKLDTEDTTNERKLIKSQVEKRRRERMNRSLERLRTMLPQEPRQQGGTQRRVEKAEILEHTVLFLQSSAEGGKMRAAGAAGGQKLSFQDGFSSCLQTAAQFLSPDRKGLWLGAALDASLAARFPPSDSDAAGVQRRPEARCSSGSLSHSKSILRLLRQKSKHRLHMRVSGAAHQQGFPKIPQQAQRQNQFEIRQVTKQRRSQSSPVSQTLWRPWP